MPASTFGAVRRSNESRPARETAPSGAIAVPGDHGHAIVRRGRPADRRARSATGRCAAASGCQPSASSSTTFGVSRGVIREAIKVLARSAGRSPPGQRHLRAQRHSHGHPCVHALGFARCGIDRAALRVPAHAGSRSGARWRRCAAATTSSRAIAAAADATARALELGRLERVRRGRQRLSCRGGSGQRQSLLRGGVATAREMQQDVVPLISDRVGSVRSAVAASSGDRRGDCRARSRSGRAGRWPSTSSTPRNAVTRAFPVDMPADDAVLGSEERHERARHHPEGEPVANERTEQAGSNAMFHADRGALLGLSADHPQHDPGCGRGGLSRDQRRAPQLPRVPVEPAGPGNSMDRSGALPGNDVRPDHPGRPAKHRHLGRRRIDQPVRAGIDHRPGAAPVAAGIQDRLGVGPHSLAACRRSSRPTCGG